MNEELDRHVLDSIAAKDAESLCTLPVELLESGSSEIRNWITAAGVMDGHPVDWCEYVPIVRSIAGTGCATAFLSWA